MVALYLHDGREFAPVMARDAWRSLRSRDRDSYTEQSGQRSVDSRRSELDGSIRLGATRTTAILALMVDETVVRHCLSDRAEAESFMVLAHDDVYAHKRDADGVAFIEPYDCDICLGIARGVGVL